MGRITDIIGTLRSSFRIDRATLSSSSLTAARAVALPDKSGTVAMTSDVDTRLVNDFSGLAEVTANAGTDTLPVNQSGAKRTTLAKVLSWFATQAVTWSAKQTFSAIPEFQTSVGIGTATPLYGPYSRGLTVQGTGAAAVEIASSRMDVAGGIVGSLDWQFRTANAGNETMAFFRLALDGETSGNRGANLNIAIKKDNVTNPVSRLQFAQNGRITLNGLINITNNGLEGSNAGASNGFSITGGQSPTQGRIYFGDGTGWHLRFTRRSSAGVDTDHTSFRDNGNAYFTGFVSIGESSPSIKTKKITGTTNSSQGQQVSVAHGLTLSKIIAINCIVTNSSGAKVPQNMKDGVNHYFVHADSSDLIVGNAANESSLVVSRPFVAFIIYEE